MTTPAISFGAAAAPDFVVKRRSASNASDADTHEGSAASDDDTASSKSSCSPERAPLDGQAKGAALLAVMQALPVPPAPARTPLSSKAPAFQPGGARAKLSSAAPSFVPKLPGAGAGGPAECWADPTAGCGAWQGQALPWLPLDPTTAFCPPMGSTPAFCPWPGPAVPEPWGFPGAAPALPDPYGAPQPPARPQPPADAAGVAPDKEPAAAAPAAAPEADAKRKTIVLKGKAARPRWADLLDEDDDDSDEVDA